MKTRLILELLRLEESDQGTLGILKINKEVFCFTLEPPDQLNKTNSSSIPVQQYMCRKFNSPHFGQTIQILNVPDRTFVLFHAGNIATDTNGCILLGDKAGFLDGKRAVLNSKKTFGEFMEIMESYNCDIHLSIRTDY